MIRFNFKPYTSDQLQEIVSKRLEGAQSGREDAMPEYITVDAIKFASKKIASISGDARRVLDICRLAILQMPFKSTELIVN
jgi:origin recognition complex subunit 1